VFGDLVAIQDHQIYMKLNDLKKIDKNTWHYNIYLISLEIWYHFINQIVKALEQLAVLA
jgi:hypothetical protein